MQAPLTSLLQANIAGPETVSDPGFVMGMFTMVRSSRVRILTTSINVKTASG